MRYKIELRDKDGELLKDILGNSITNNRIYFEDSEEEPNLINMICEDTSNIYQAITPKGTCVSISVVVYSTISNTYMCMYSYYSNDKRFITHK
jgi:hypothetical protein